MKNKKVYYIAGAVLVLIAAAFIAFALKHPELSFPWPNWVSCVLYALYGIYTLLIFLMPCFKNASIWACLIVAVDFIALSLIAIFAGLHGTEHESSMYLIVGLLLTAWANFANIAMQNKQKKQDGKKDKGFFGIM